LGIEIVSSNSEVREIALTLNDEDTHLLTKLEREFISKIGAGCSAPVAVNATLDGTEVKIESMIGYPNGTNILHRSLKASRNKAQNLGEELASLMIADGALKILENAEKLAFKDEMPQRL
jgi:hydroxymethylbilane synthase